MGIKKRGRPKCGAIFTLAAMSFLTPPLKTKPAGLGDVRQLTLSQGKKKRKIAKVLDLKDDDGGASSSEEEFDYKAMSFNKENVVENDSESDSDSECEVLFDSLSSPAKATPSTPANHFALDFQVSSVAVDRAGRFVVAGFNNGTIRLYPLVDNFKRAIDVGVVEVSSVDANALVFRKGVVLEHITARGMYTTLRVHVVIPEDGRFIFAGVYRGSTEILVIDIDSIVLPTETIGVPTAEVVTHSYNDAKLRGFGAVRAVPGDSLITTEYQVLCGLGIKNLHLWRFYWDPSSDDDESKWTWQCVFDRQTNGISLEYLSFGPGPNQVISKSEHQAIRVWTLSEATADDGTIASFEYTDIKHTTDAVEVFGHYAYGGSERLALVDLDNSKRFELDLPSSSAVAAARPTLNFRKRQLRTLSNLTGDPMGVTLGMCSDGSVFVHKATADAALGVHTPPTYVPGYESFYQDQGGLLTLLPFEIQDEKEWMVVSANTNELRVHVLHEFLGEPKQAFVAPTKPRKLKLTAAKELKVKKTKKNSKKTPSPPPSVVDDNDTFIVRPLKVKVVETPAPVVVDVVPNVLASPPLKRKLEPEIAAVATVAETKKRIKASPWSYELKPLAPKPVAIVVHPPAVTPALVTPVKRPAKIAVPSPVVSISPCSSPVLPQTPAPSTPTKKVVDDQRDWSPFVIPKRRNKELIMDEPAVVAEAPPSPVKAMTPPPVEVIPSRLDTIAEVATIVAAVEPTLDAAPPSVTPSPFASHARSLLMQLTTCMLDEDEPMDIDEKLANETMARFEAQQAQLKETFTRGHRQLIRTVCNDMHRRGTAMLEPGQLQDIFQKHVDELIRVQQLEADALHAKQLVEWTILGLCDFSLPRVHTAFPVPRLFG
ncbi:hypothetical protein SDRG_05694 [Saprolegnia diclina VS20]|uniref:Uncharacterized protein n=1 Tax=Saprolegnia diclina (strain VS20) TaxID=1156394 RepID=T0QFY8_SAPDV|nr:hypothetical protein SDRG_05694 [Saprolegnia diclina VS20]EQC36864.1 hypothetical protein SDRG_05694 [Saprolegnia diclina VS20]|eukprot:XP_008609645.1 hypothetical protein SDRG_05694 [Saprolegnia diclina VS20]